MLVPRLPAIRRERLIDMDWVGSTPIRNLHLTGAAVWPGAGTGAGSGYLLARKLT